jgi:hypothetical protein
MDKTRSSAKLGNAVNAAAAAKAEIEYFMVSSRWF